MLVEAGALGLSYLLREYRCCGNAIEGYLGPSYPGISTLLSAAHVGGANELEFIT